MGPAWAVPSFARRRNPPGGDAIVRELERRARQGHDVDAALAYTQELLVRRGDLRQLLALNAEVWPVVGTLLLSTAPSAAERITSPILASVVEVAADALAMTVRVVAAGIRPFDLRHAHLFALVGPRVVPVPVYMVAAAAGPPDRVVTVAGFYAAPGRPWRGPSETGIGWSFEQVEPWLSEPAVAEPAVGVERLSPGASSELPSLLYRVRVLGRLAEAWQRFTYDNVRGQLRPRPGVE